MRSYPHELDTDDIEALAAYIERRYPAEEVRMRDTEMIHFAYWDVSPHSVSTVFLEHIQRAGYRVLHAGVAKAPSRGRRCAWAECRKPESEENGAVDEQVENTNEDGGWERRQRGSTEQKTPNNRKAPLFRSRSSIITVGVL
jgi:hypothetical protein